MQGFLVSLTAATVTLASSCASAQTVPDRGEYYYARGSISCQGPRTSCTLSFPELTARTLITRISCVIVTSGTLRTAALEDTSKTQNARMTEPLAISGEPVLYNGNNWHSINWNADLLLSPGATPAISMEVFPAGSNSLSCTITGRKGR